MNRCDFKDSHVHMQPIGSEVIGDRDRATTISKITSTEAILVTICVLSAQAFHVRTHFYMKSKNRFQIIRNQLVA